MSKFSQSISTINVISLPNVEESITSTDYERGVSLWQDALRRLSKNKLAMAGLIYLILLSIAAIAAPWIAPFSYEETDHLIGAVPPDWTHWLGTDDLGRDLFTRILYGARVSLLVGVISTVVSVVIGVLYGAIAGYVGGKTDNLMMRFVEILYALPFTILVIVIMTITDRSLINLFIALGAVQWLVMARIVRGQVVSIKKMEYVEAARATGVSNTAIIFRHIIPNTYGPVIVFSTLTVPAVILEEAFLSFLGLGVQPPMSSWGTLISEGIQGMEAYPWMILFPCLSLVITLLALNFLGDGLRDALDPKASKD
jgi:oligopeptide transport system permease protein